METPYEVDGRIHSLAENLLAFEDKLSTDKKRGSKEVKAIILSEEFRRTCEVRDIELIQHSSIYPAFESKQTASGSIYGTLTLVNNFRTCIRK